MNYYVAKNKKRKRRKAQILLGFFFLFIASCFLYFYMVVTPSIIEATEFSIFSLSTSAVSDAIYDVLDQDHITYDDLVEVKYDSEGNVSMISLQTVTINEIARKFYQVAQIYLDSMGKNGVDVPLGTFTGIPAFSGFGPKINLKLVSIGAMTSTFKSDFTTAGINQTKHSLYIHLFASVSLIMPAYSQTIDSVTEMLVAESVVVGKVPSVYLGGGLNFTPSV